MQIDKAPPLRLSLNNLCVAERPVLQLDRFRSSDSPTGMVTAFGRSSGWTIDVSPNYHVAPLLLNLQARTHASVCTRWLALLLLGLKCPSTNSMADETGTDQVGSAQNPVLVNIDLLTRIPQGLAVCHPWNPIVLLNCFGNLVLA
jgi:hypothetical protein